MEPFSRVVYHSTTAALSRFTFAHIYFDGDLRQRGPQCTSWGNSQRVFFFICTAAVCAWYTFVHVVWKGKERLLKVEAIYVERLSTYLASNSLGIARSVLCHRQFPCCVLLSLRTFDKSISKPPFQLPLVIFHFHHLMRLISCLINCTSWLHTANCPHRGLVTLAVHSASSLYDYPSSRAARFKTFHLKCSPPFHFTVTLTSEDNSNEVFTSSIGRSRAVG